MLKLRLTKGDEGQKESAFGLSFPLLRLNPTPPSFRVVLRLWLVFAARPYMSWAIRGALHSKKV